MRGKNTGKQRRSIKKQQTVAELKHLFDAPGRGSVMPRQVLWGDLCLTALPHELNSESTAPMHREALFPPQFCTKFNIIQSIGVNYILADEAYERQHLQPILAASLTIGMQICIAP
ncbi:hypothetical protein KXX16_007460 [Aspergillus fumigatus]|uniref:Uncharacterized protein n=1 Tax=Aspergillus fumigatus TaxID=746128 RepID=A0A8H4IA43_ASPFM|nr:hypothetical protein CNMCM8689_007223 [Aspergillus fumigatus]KAF4292244.1 hypothetical protein CNMCM8686_007773 [Aspergillus fumigatus]KAH1330391.1 hypothetical protein KXX38_000816 [Aspergillus fumigatus]KAH1363674.1 hypothetical protein KXX14_007195 [Aspergillus fumigatus]KAH1396347.1 hypothetical protein KXX49_007911 [Aspergillus fumigatus]